MTRDNRFGRQCSEAYINAATAGADDFNKTLAATGLIATCEAVAMGVKAGLDATTMIDVLNAGSGGHKRQP